MIAISLVAAASSLFLNTAFVLLDKGGAVISTFSDAQAPMPGYAVIPDDDPRIATYNADSAAACDPGSVKYDGSDLIVCSTTGRSTTTMPGPLVRPEK